MQNKLESNYQTMENAIVYLHEIKEIMQQGNPSGTFYSLSEEIDRGLTRIECVLENIKILASN